MSAQHSNEKRTLLWILFIVTVGMLGAAAFGLWYFNPRRVRQADFTPETIPITEETAESAPRETEISSAEADGTEEPERVAAEEVELALELIDEPEQPPAEEVELALELIDEPEQPPAEEVLTEELIADTEPLPSVEPEKRPIHPEPDQERTAAEFERAPEERAEAELPRGKPQEKSTEKPVSLEAAEIARAESAGETAETPRIPVPEVPVEKEPVAAAGEREQPAETELAAAEPIPDEQAFPEPPVTEEDAEPGEPVTEAAAEPADEAVPAEAVLPMEEPALTAEAAAGEPGVPAEDEFPLEEESAPEEVSARAETPSYPLPDRKPMFWAVAGTFYDLDEAEQGLHILRELGFAGSIALPEIETYRLRVGPFAGIDEAAAAVAHMRGVDRFRTSAGIKISLP